MQKGNLKCSNCGRVIPFDYETKKSLRGSSITTTDSISYSVEEDGRLLCYDCICESNPPETKTIGYES